MKIADVGKRLLLGRKLRSTQLGETLLPKRIAAPIFAAVALSSVAYAPDEILITLSLAGSDGFRYAWRVAILVAVVMVIVVASYRQNVRAYPSGGGDYDVASTNLGRRAGMGVASALLVDYMLTVAVSVSSAVHNAEALFPFLKGYETIAAVLIVFVLAALNLRGVKGSGRCFAVPVYCFVIGLLVMIVWGLVRIVIAGEDVRVASAQYEVQGVEAYTGLAGFAFVMLMARSFSAGSAMLTGVESITHAVPSFQRPKSKNAGSTLALLAVFAVTMMMGVVVLANLTGMQLIDPPSTRFTADGQPVPVNPNTAIGQLARAIFAGFPVGFYFVLIATFLILVLAANTAFDGFPVLGSILARDGLLPRQLHTRGDRLAFSNGIILLAVGAVVLVVAFGADVSELIQLYVVGVFISFTTSQLGMVVHWTRHLAEETNRRARRRMLRARVINTAGAICTAAVLVIVLVSKFLQGAWITLIAMAVIFALMLWINRHYANVAAETEIDAGEEVTLPSRVRAVVLVSKLHKPTLRALAFAKASRPSTVEAITVDVDADETARLVEQWEKAGIRVPLKVIASPYREITNPALEFVNDIRRESPRDVVTVYIPEYVVGHWWEQFLHNQSALRLKARLLFTPGVMVTSVPHVLQSSGGARRRIESGEDRHPRSSPGR